MKIVKNAFAGTLESSDAFVQIEKTDENGIQIELDSSVEEIYGDDIRALISNVVQKIGVENVLVKVQDKGAFDFVIEARVKTAILRASEQDIPQWSKL